MKAAATSTRAWIIRMLNAEFNAFAESPTLDLYPEGKRARIDELNEKMYESINNGVYKCGFATTQAAYEKAFHELQGGLEFFEGLLSSQRWLSGNGPQDLTEADVRLAMTLFRFDAVYHTHFKCNGRLIREFPALSAWLRDVYQYREGAIGKTINIKHIKAHYYGSHHKLNPYGIIPIGTEEDFSRPHGREKLSEVK
jgi:glutathionyl-hydroquinone reductase